MMYRTAIGALAASSAASVLRLRHQLRGRHDAVDQADAQRFVGVDLPARQQQLERDALARPAAGGAACRA